MTATAKLFALQQKYCDDAVSAEDGWPGRGTMLLFSPTPFGIHVEYYGAAQGDELAPLLETLADPVVANELASLVLTGPDEGANGTRDWILTPLLDSDVVFSRLRSIHVRPTEPSDHCSSLIHHAEQAYQEHGEIARLVDKAPRLVELTVPNAPNAAFFTVPLPELVVLRIGGGYDTQRFIANLARATNLPSLRVLDFAEAVDTYLAWPDGEQAMRPTPFSAFEVLVGGRFSTQLRALTLRNTCLSRHELEALQARAPTMAIQVIQSTHGVYVQHFAKDVFPWEHLMRTAPKRRKLG